VTPGADGEVIVFGLVKDNASSHSSNSSRAEALSSVGMTEGLLRRTS
jgi:hypothetical protein